MNGVFTQSAARDDSALLFERLNLSKVFMVLRKKLSVLLHYLFFHLHA